MYTLKECHGLNPCTLSGKTPEGGGMKDAPYHSFQIISPLLWWGASVRNPSHLAD